MSRRKYWSFVGLSLVIILSPLLLVFTPSKAQVGQSQLSRVGGVYNSSAYKDWGAYIASGNTATGSQTITICPWFVNLRDGRVIQPFLADGSAVFTPITVDIGSNSEVVTPTASSQIANPNGGPQPCASVTASFSNTHAVTQSGGVTNVTTGDAGIQEAITDAAQLGGGQVYFEIDPGVVTLNTGGQTTNMGSIKIPARSLVAGASAKVTTTITTCAGGWSLGIVGGSGTDFTAANTTLTAGTNTDSSTLASGLPVKTTTAQLPTVFCTTSAAAAGAVHARYWGYKVVPPAF